MIGSDPAENEDRRPYPFVLQSNTDDEPFDIDALDEFDPFEIDRQHAPLFKHHALGVDDIYEIWKSDPIVFPPNRRHTGSWSPTSLAKC